MSLQGLVHERFCPKCGELPVLSGYSGESYWWCGKCRKEINFTKLDKLKEKK